MKQAAAKEQGISFCNHMVLALARSESPKTQTRRIVTEVKGIGAVTEFQRSDTRGYDWTFRDRRTLWNDLKDSDIRERCPMGKVGDRLRIREAFQLDKDPCLVSGGYGVTYEADGARGLLSATDFGRLNLKPGKAYQPRYMPFCIARYMIELTNIRVELLQEISPEDAIAEGVVPNWCGELTEFDPEEHGYLPWWPDGDTIEGADPYDHWERPVDAYEFLWDSLHGMDPAGCWKANPAAWVLELRLIRGGAPA